MAKRTSAPGQIPGTQRCHLSYFFLVIKTRGCGEKRVWTEHDKKANGQESKTAEASLTPSVPKKAHRVRWKWTGPGTSNRGSIAKVRRSHSLSFNERKEERFDRGHGLRHFPRGDNALILKEFRERRVPCKHARMTKRQNPRSDNPNILICNDKRESAVADIDPTSPVNACDPRPVRSFLIIRRGAFLRSASGHR